MQWVLVTAFRAALSMEQDPRVWEARLVTRKQVHRRPVGINPYNISHYFADFFSSRSQVLVTCCFKAWWSYQHWQIIFELKRGPMSDTSVFVYWYLVPRETTFVPPSILFQEEDRDKISAIWGRSGQNQRLNPFRKDLNTQLNTWQGAEVVTKTNSVSIHTKNSFILGWRQFANWNYINLPHLLMFYDSSTFFFSALWASFYTYRGKQ